MQYIYVIDAFKSNNLTKLDWFVKMSSDFCSFGKKHGKE